MLLNYKNTVEAEWGFVAQLHQLSRCMEDENSFEEVKKASATLVSNQIKCSELEQLYLISSFWLVSFLMNTAYMQL